MFFEMKDLGELYYCLGLEIWRATSQTLITQRNYTRKLLKRFKMDQCMEVLVPLEQERWMVHYITIGGKSKISYCNQARHSIFNQHPQLVYGQAS